MKKLTTKKNVLILGCAAVTTLVIGLAYYASQRAAVGTIATEGISERSLEFVENQQGTGTSVWNQHEIADPDAPQAPTSNTFRTPCFSVTVPYQSFNQKIRTDGSACVFEAKVLKPPAQLVIKVATNSGSLSEASGLQMRLKEPTKYPQASVAYPGFDQSYHFIAEDAVTLFLAKGSAVITVALNSSGSKLVLDQAALSSLVDSIRLTN